VRRPTSRDVVRWSVPAVGAALVWSSLAFVGYAAGWTIRKQRAETHLVAQVKTVNDTFRGSTPATRTGYGIGSGSTSAATAPKGPCVQAAPTTGQLTGVLDIPSLGLQAPVEEGTDDAELAVAAGHAPASVWPGQTGSSVLLAHDVSYFVHLGALAAGDLITYRNQCTTVTFRVTGRQVVAAGSPVYNSATPTLVLDTCWPTNALFFTSQRLLVTAAEVSTGSTTSATPKPNPKAAPATLTGIDRMQQLVRSVLPAPTASPDPALAMPTLDTVAYTTPAPPDLVAQGLTLSQNEAPMGTLTLTGDPSTAFEESPGPLNLTSAALAAYFGGLHAGSQQRTDWWSAVAPGVPMPAVLTGATVTGHDGPLDVSIDSVGGTPDAVTLTTRLTISGGPAPGTYDQTVTLAVAGSDVTIRTWGMTDA